MSQEIQLYSQEIQLYSQGWEGGEIKKKRKKKGNTVAEEIQWLQIFMILKTATTSFSICLPLPLEYYLNLSSFIACLQNRGHCENNIFNDI